MIRYLFGSQLDEHCDLSSAMFRDRTAQFRDRMGWDVIVDPLGWETDEFDALDPLYVIAEDATGGHAGSLRFLPTTGPTMLRDVFPHLTGGRAIRDRLIWECTRFCLSPSSDGTVTRRLLLAASELGLGMGLSHAVGVFDFPMVRIYRRLGWPPEDLRSADGISAGIWTFSDQTHDLLCGATGISARASRDWYEAQLGDVLPLPVRA